MCYNQLYDDLKHCSFRGRGRIHGMAILVLNAL